jgi:hypothetical protein
MQQNYNQMAQGLASLGRGDDSMLMHITPDEFQDFNRMAQSAGMEHIPINPMTGLPEFGFGKAFKSVGKVVKSVTKSVAKVLSSPLVAPLVGIAATAFGVPPWLTGVVTGGITTLGTGSLTKGIMTGLGAYGGANLGQTFMTQGANAAGMTTNAANAAQAAGQNAGTWGTSAAQQGLGSIGNTAAPGMFSTAAGNFSDMMGGVGDLFSNPQGIGAGWTNFKDAMGSPAVAPGIDSVGNVIPGKLAESAGNWEALAGLAAPVAGPLLESMAEPLPVEELPTEPTEEPYVYEPLYLSDSANSSANRLQLYGPEYTGYGREQWEKNPTTVSAAEGGYLSGGGIKSLGDGMSDEILATIDGKQEARLSDGEFVIPADVVSHLGNGSSNAGAKNLYAMMDRIRQARTGTEKQGNEINIGNYMPA